MSKSSELAHEQKELIREYQQTGLSEEKLSRLISSFHGIAKVLGEKWHPSFPQSTPDELAAEADYATFLALKKFDCDRGVCPSTFFYRVMYTHIAKKWWHDRTRCVRVDTEQKDPKTGRPVKLHLQHVSLSSYMDEHGDINEIGRASDNRLHKTVHLNDRLACLEQLCENNLLVHRVVTRVVQISSSCTGRTRSTEVMKRVARELGVSVDDVERVINTVRNHVDDHDLLMCLTKLRDRLVASKPGNVDVTDLVMKTTLTDVTEMLRWAGQL
jgi:galactitol-specific phosphotransferase system IIB component